jgi:hypothetical protein
MRVFVLALLVAFLTSSSHADCLSRDLNCDCIVDMKDLVLFSVEWLSGADSHANLNGDSDVDISRWYFSSGISYTFPMNTKLAAEAFLIVAQNPQEIFYKWGSIAVPPSLVFGPFIGNRTKHAVGQSHHRQRPWR